MAVFLLVGFRQRERFGATYVLRLFSGQQTENPVSHTHTLFKYAFYGFV